MFSSSNGRAGVPLPTLCLEDNPEGFFVFSPSVMSVLCCLKCANLGNFPSLYHLIFRNVWPGSIVKVDVWVLSC